MTVIRNVNIKSQDSPSIDAFGRWRVSNPVTVFDSKQIFDNQPLFWDDSEVSGGTTSSTYTANKSMTQMGVAASTAGKRVRQTFMRFNYRPGKSQLVMMTGLMSATPSGIEMNIGPHDDDNGIFFQVLDGTLNAVIRSKTSGSAVDTKVAQSAWNGDRLNGTGASGITLDMTKVQIMWFDYEWLGVGRVRTGFVINGMFILCHEFNHANSDTSVYMTTPNLPLRYSIENDGSGVATTLDHICSTVISEGGSEPLGMLHYASTSGASFTAATIGIIYAVVGIRLKAAQLGATIDVTDISIAEEAGSKDFEWILYLNPTVAGTFAYTDLDTDISVQVARGAATNTVTNGHEITGGFASSASKGGTSGEDIRTALRIGADIAGTADTMVLCVRPTGTANLTVEGSMTFRQSS